MIGQLHTFLRGQKLQPRRTFGAFFYVCVHDTPKLTASVPHHRARQLPPPIDDAIKYVKRRFAARMAGVSPLNKAESDGAESNERSAKEKKKEERKGDFFGRIYRPQKESHKSTYISEYVPFNAHAMCASCPERSSSVCVGVLRRIITPLTARCLLAPTITVVCVHAGWLAGRPA